MPFHREDRSVLRARARRRVDSSSEGREGRHVDMLKDVVNQANEDEEVTETRSGMFNEVDGYPANANTIESIYYQLYKKTCNSVSRETFIEILDELIVRKGKEIIQSLAKENKLKKFCADLLKDVRDESNEQIRHFLCRLIGNLAEKRNDSWPELHRFIKCNVSSTDRSLHQTTLELIGNWNRPMVEWSTVKNLIVENILCQDSTLCKPAIQALLNFINKSCNENREMMDIFEKLAPILLEVAEEGCTPVKCNKAHLLAFECLCGMARDTPRVLRHQVEKIVPFCTESIIDPIRCKKRNNPHCALQTLTFVCEKYGPSVPTEHIPDIVSSCLLSISKCMDDTVEWLAGIPARTDPTILHDWAITMGKWYWMKIASDIGKKKVSPHLVAITQQFLKDEKWEKRAAALIGWSVVPPNFHQGRAISLIDSALSVVEDKHPRVRYYAFFLLNLIFLSYDLKDHRERFEKVLSSNILALSDPIPRLANGAVLALGSLFTGICPHDILINKYDAVIPLIISMISTEDKTTVFWIISFLAVAVGKDRFKEDFTKVVSSMGPWLFIDTDDDLFISSIVRICQVMGADCVSLLKMAMKNDMNAQYRHQFLAILIKAVHTDNVDSRSEMIEDEKKIAPYVKRLCMDSECIDKAKLTEEEKETMKRLLAYPDE